MYEKSIDEMHELLFATLEKQQLSQRTISGYSRIFRKLCRFMQENSYVTYNSQVGCDFMTAECSQRPRSYYSTVQSVVSLLDYIVADKPYRQNRLCVALELEFPNELGACAKKFIHQLSLENRFSPHTTRQYDSVLSKFTTYMSVHNIEIEDIDSLHISEYFGSLPEIKPYIYTPIRRFLEYLFIHKQTKKDLSERLEIYKVKRPEKLPSIYSAEEITSMEKSIEKDSRIGKRNYAMFLLASRLGLRSSDIRQLQFENIDWDNNRIYIKQYKTGKEIELPLLKIVGEAIANYILYGRPKSSSKYVFLDYSGRKTISVGRFSDMISRIMTDANIDYRHRHHGPHCLRHSFAANLLNTGVSLPVISESLGHMHTSSTMTYLGIELDGLLKCSLDVPTVPDSFYTQKGGWFYEK